MRVSAALAALVGLPLILVGAAAVDSPKGDLAAGASPIASRTPAARDATPIRRAITAVLDPSAKRPTMRLPRVSIDATGDLTVVFALRDEGSFEGIRTAALTDALAILRAVYRSPSAAYVRTATVIGTFSITGPRGPREMPVLRAVLSAERASHLDWANVRPEQLPTLVDDWFQYPPLLGDAGISPPATAAPSPVASRAAGRLTPRHGLLGGRGDTEIRWGP